MSKILMAVIGNDVHVVANRIIDHYFSSQGHTVFNLGVACKPCEVVDGILETEPDVLIISSLNGEALNWTDMLLKKLDNLPVAPFLVLGGNLFPRANHENLSVEDKEKVFLDKGFNCVLSHERPLSSLVKSLEPILQVS